MNETSFIFRENLEKVFSNIEDIEIIFDGFNKVAEYIDSAVCNNFHKEKGLAEQTIVEMRKQIHLLQLASVPLMKDTDKNMRVLEESVQFLE